MVHALDRLVFEVMDDSRVDGDLDRRIRETLVACFPADEAHFSRDRTWHTRPVWVVLALEEDGTVAAHCAMVVRTVRAGGNAKVTVAGVQSFSVLPQWRGTGLSHRIMELALDEARRRNIDAGLLFCLPELEKVYERTGWRTIDASVFMRGDHDEPEPIPGKNIAMAAPLAISYFPPGDIDLMGPDW